MASKGNYDRTLVNYDRPWQNIKTALNLAWEEEEEEGGDQIKVMRTRVSLKAAAEDKVSYYLKHGF